MYISIYPYTHLRRIIKPTESYHAIDMKCYQSQSQVPDKSHRRQGPTYLPTSPTSTNTRYQILDTKNQTPNSSHKKPKKIPTSTYSLTHSHTHILPLSPSLHHVSNPIKLNPTHHIQPNPSPQKDFQSIKKRNLQPPNPPTLQPSKPPTL